MSMLKESSTEAKLGQKMKDICHRNLSLIVLNT